MFEFTESDRTNCCVLFKYQNQMNSYLISKGFEVIRSCFNYSHSKRFWVFFLIMVNPKIEAIWHFQRSRPEYRNENCHVEICIPFNFLLFSLFRRPRRFPGRLSRMRISWSLTVTMKKSGESPTLIFDIICFPSSFHFERTPFMCSRSSSFRHVAEFNVFDRPSLRTLLSSLSLRLPSKTWLF